LASNGKSGAERERVARRPVMHPPDLKRKRKLKKQKRTQPNQTTYWMHDLMHGAINFFDTKRSLDTTMFPTDIQTINHWETGVGT